MGFVITMEFGMCIPPVPSWLEEVQSAEKAGFHQIWLNADFNYHESFSTLSYAATQTSRIRLGPYSNSVFLRHPVLCASGYANLDIFSGGRAVANYCSAGSETVIGLGIPNEHANESIREAVEITRKLFKGETLNYQGTYYTVNDIQLWLPGRPDIPIFISTRGGKAKLAGEVADGILTHGVALPYIQQLRDHIREGAHRAGRQPADVQLASIAPIFVTEDPDEAIKGIIPMLAALIGSEDKPDWLRTFGVTLEEAQPFLDSWRSDVDYTKLPDMLTPKLTAKLAKGYAIIGTAEECIHRIQELEQHGLTQIAPMVDMALPTTVDQMHEIIEVVGTKIMPAFQD